MTSSWAGGLLHRWTGLRGVVVQKDKVGHLAGGMGLGLGTSMGVKVSFGARVQPKITFRAGVGSGLIAGVGKEVLDHRANMALQAQGRPKVHGVEAADAGATLAGAVLGAYLASLFQQ